MATLIHLNGPPGIGKSTLATLYADQHPGTLNIDVDILHRLVGGWQSGDGRTHDILRPVALAMAGAHLSGGRDVILPQHLGRVEEIEAFEQVAAAHAAGFREIILVADRAEAIERFERRRVDDDWDDYNRQLVADLGGAQFLSAMYDQISEVRRLRPGAVVIQAEPGAVAQTYAALVQALA